MAHIVTEFPGHITTWPINRLAMFVATFVIMFRCVRGHVVFMFVATLVTLKTRFLKFFSVFFEKFLKSAKCD